MKRTSSIGLILTLTLFMASCDSTANREKEEQNKREAQQTKVKNDLAAKFGASTDWDKNLKDRLFPYSVDLEEALIRSDKKPILFEGFVSDITKQNDRYLARLSYIKGPRIYFLLECTAELATRLRSRDGFDKLSVIASISSVRKPNIKLESQRPSDPEESPDIEVTDPDAFIARGSMLDFAFME